MFDGSGNFTGSAGQHHTSTSHTPPDVLTRIHQGPFAIGREDTKKDASGRSGPASSRQNWMIGIGISALAFVPVFIISGSIMLVIGLLSLGIVSLLIGSAKSK